MNDTDTETVQGTCVTHGRVHSTRQIPRMGFPFVYYGFVRMLARRRPFACPVCGSPVGPA